MAQSCYGDYSMHIPDGLMSPEVLLLGWIVSVPIVAFAIWKLNKNIDERAIPFMAMLAAGIFVAQMLNFPVGGGTTGHLIGAALAVILLGPYAAIVVITAILIIQCFVFGDGGVTALGLNIAVMAIVAPLIAWMTTKFLSGRLDKVGMLVGAWLSVVIAALVCALGLSLSYELSNGAYGIAASIAIPAMFGYHILIGIGEAAITGGVVLYLAKVSPGTLRLKEGIAGTTAIPTKGYVKAAFGIMLAFAIGLVGFFAFSAAYGDGLEVTMEQAGVQEIEPLFTSIMGYGEDYGGALIAGIAGFALLMTIMMTYWMVKRSRTAAEMKADKEGSV
jgi:cobalt/nickel transport system permease protein